MSGSGDLFDRASAVASRADFLCFLEYLRADRADNKGEWENNDLGSFLAGLEGFCHDIDGYYLNAGEVVDVETITWRMAAQMLLAATVYE
ncbi:MAG TPA: hypothetical protein VIT45_10330 [Allosphingosinicella sp.]